MWNIVIYGGVFATALGIEIYQRYFESPEDKAKRLKEIEEQKLKAKKAEEAKNKRIQDNYKSYLADF